MILLLGAFFLKFYRTSFMKDTQDTQRKLTSFLLIITQGARVAGGPESICTENLMVSKQKLKEQSFILIHFPRSPLPPSLSLCLTYFFLSLSFFVFPSLISTHFHSLTLDSKRDFGNSILDYPQKACNINSSPNSLGRKSIFLFQSSIVRKMYFFLLHIIHVGMFAT